MEYRQETGVIRTDLNNNRKRMLQFDMLPSYRTMKYKSPIWGYFHVQKKQNRSNSKGKNS